MKELAKARLIGRKKTRRRTCIRTKVGCGVGGSVLPPNQLRGPTKT